MSPKKFSQQTDEERIAAFLVSLACELNKRCGKRKTSEGVPEAYSGYSVEKDLLESAVYAPFQVFSNHRPRYASPYDRAAALIVHIAKGHPFGDGNKRTALHLGLSHLRYLSIRITEPDGEAGSRFVEEIVISSHPYDLLIRQASQLLQEWTEPDATAKSHRSKPNE